MNGGLALFGGTFNPPHRTHERILKACLQQLPIAKVIVIPAGLHPHKRSQPMLRPDLRFDLCRLAFGDLENVEVSDFETMRTEPSFTIDTVRHFRNKWPLEEPLYCVIGSDNLPLLPSWKDHHQILKWATIVTYPRKGYPIDPRLLAQIDLSLEERRSLLAHVLDIEPDEVSATMIRAALREGRNVDELLHPRVIERIRTLSLFESP